MQQPPCDERDHRSRRARRGSLRARCSGSPPPVFASTRHRSWRTARPTGTDRSVCDASAVVAFAARLGAGRAAGARPARRWAAVRAALVPFEAANVIRRHELAGLVSADQAAQAHGDLLDLTIDE